MGPLSVSRLIVLHNTIKLAEVECFVGFSLILRLAYGTV